MKQVFLFLIGIISVTTSLFAQVAKPIQFREESFDFGYIDETQGSVTHEFLFTNMSTRPIKIMGVRPSCGCTTPNWTKEPIMPGKTGFIQARFDPTGRPGYFNKTLTVTTDFDSNPIVLQIKGQVNSKEGVMKSEYTVAMGSWKLRSISFNLGKIYLKDEYVVREYQFVNDGTKAVTFLGTVEAPAHIKVTVEPKSVDAGEMGSIQISYNGKLKNQYGFQSDNIVIHTDDALQSKKSFSVFATLEEYFEPVSPADAGKVARLSVSNTTIDFGRMQQNEDVVRQTMITNSGKSVLQIRSLQGNCTCIQVVADKTELKPGESVAVKISFNPQNRKGTQQKAVTIYSTDPINPVQRVTLTGYVE
jgi:hypothetical protein